MKVAVVHNGNHEGVLQKFGRPCPEKYSLKHVQMVVEALQSGGHTVTTLEADVTLFDQLRTFLTNDSTTNGFDPASVDWDTSGIVFNMAYGIQGDARYTHLPAMLEMAGIPYTGSTPLGHALALDKVVTKVLMLDAGVPTPAYCVLGGSDVATGLGQKWSADDLRYPLIVKPRHESTSYGLKLVTTKDELDDAVDSITQRYQQSALVEEYIDGREVCIGMLGNEPMEFLPPLELDFGNRELRLMTWDDKYHKRTDEPTKVCPAPLESEMEERLNELAMKTFHACHLRDYARVDIRIDHEGNPFVLEVNSMASLGDGGSFVKAAMSAGYNYDSLINRVVEVTRERYSQNHVDSIPMTH
jgi:D-alanine-D-alanine ligase